MKTVREMPAWRHACLARPFPIHLVQVPFDPPVPRVPSLPAPITRHPTSRLRAVLFWSGAALLVLMAALWPLGQMFPVVLTYTASPEPHLVSGPLPGWGSSLGFCNGRLYCFHGTAIRNPLPASSEPGVTDFHVDLSDWVGTPACGIGTRCWGLARSDFWLRQTGILLPTWVPSTLAAAALALLLGRRFGVGLRMLRIQLASGFSG